MKRGAGNFLWVLALLVLVGASGFVYGVHEIDDKHTIYVTSQYYTQPIIHDILIVFDASDSMKGLTPSGKTKIDAAREAVNNFLRKLPLNGRVALIVFYDCDNIQIEVDFSGTRDEVSRVLEGVSPTCGTPIAASLKEAWNYMKRNADPQNLWSIVFVTDGKEECKGSPCAVAESIADESDTYQNTPVFIIGFLIDPDSEEALQCIAEKTGGKYKPAHDNLEDILFKVGGEIIGEKPVETLGERARNLFLIYIWIPITTIFMAIHKKRHEKPERGGGREQKSEYGKEEKKSEYGKEEKKDKKKFLGYTGDEWRLCFKHPVQAWNVNGFKNDAMKRTSEKYRSGGHNNEADAYRHALWNFLMARKFGKEQAEKWANAHEEFSDNPDKEKEMDLHNNQIGRNLATNPEEILGKGDWKNKSFNDLFEEAKKLKKVYWLKK